MQEQDGYGKIAELVDCFDDIPQMLNRIRASQSSGSRFQAAEPNYSHNVTLALRNSVKFDPKAPENACQVERMAIQAKKVLDHLGKVRNDDIKVGKDITTSAKLAGDKLQSLQRSGVDIEKFYRQYDTQRTGRLSYKDFSDTLIILSADIGREDAMILAHSLDKKKTGSVDYTNLVPLLKDLQQNAQNNANNNYNSNNYNNNNNRPATSSSSPQRVSRRDAPTTNNRRSRSKIRSEINTLTSVLDQLKAFKPTQLSLDDLDNFEIDAGEEEMSTPPPSMMSHQYEPQVYPSVSASYDGNVANNAYRNNHNSSPPVSQSLDTTLRNMVKAANGKPSMPSPEKKESPKVLFGDNVAELPLTALIPNVPKPAPASPSRDPYDASTTFGTGRRFYHRFRNPQTDITDLTSRLNKPTAPYYVDPPPKCKETLPEDEQYAPELLRIVKRNRQRASSAPPRINNHMDSIIAHVDLVPPPKELRVAETNAFLNGLSAENPYAQLREQLKARKAKTKEIREDTLENTVIHQLAGRYNNFRHLLKKMDLSQSGVLNFNEFKKGLSRAGVQLEDRYVNELFVKYAKPADFNTIAGGYSSSDHYSSGGSVRMVSTSHSLATPNDIPHLPPERDIIHPNNSIHRAVDIEEFIRDLQVKTDKRNVNDSTPTVADSGVAIGTTSQTTNSIPAKEFAQVSAEARIAKKVLNTWHKLGENPHHILSRINDKHHGYLTAHELADTLNVMGQNQLQPHEFHSLVNQVRRNHENKIALKDFYSLVAKKVTDYETKQRENKDLYLRTSTNRYSKTYDSQIVLGDEEEVYTETARMNATQRRVFQQNERQWEHLKTILQNNYDKVFHAFHDPVGPDNKRPDQWEPDDSQSVASSSSSVMHSLLSGSASGPSTPTNTRAQRHWANLRNNVKLSIPHYPHGSVKTAEKMANNVVPHCVAPATELKSVSIESIANELQSAGIHLGEHDISCLKHQLYSHKYKPSSPASSAPNSPARTSLGSLLNQEEGKLSIEEFCKIIDIPVKHHAGQQAEKIELIPREERNIRDEGIFQSARVALGKERATTLLPSMVLQSDDDVRLQLYTTAKRKYPQSYESHYERNSDKILDFNTNDDPMAFPHPIPSLRDPIPPQLLEAKRIYRHTLAGQHPGASYFGVNEDGSIGGSGYADANSHPMAGPPGGRLLTAEALLANRAAGVRTHANNHRNTLEFPPFAIDPNQDTYQDDVRSLGTRESRRSQMDTSVASNYSLNSQDSKHRRRRASSAPPRSLISTNSNQGEAMRQLLSEPSKQQPVTIRGGNEQGKNGNDGLQANKVLDQGVSKWSGQALADFYATKQGANATVDLNSSRDSTASAYSYASGSTGTHTTRPTAIRGGGQVNPRQQLRQQYETKNGSGSTPFATDY